MRVIAKLDVKSPYVVKPVHFEGLRKMGNPADLAQKYYEQGADEILYVDIVASLYRREVLFDDILDASRGVFVPFAVGGGIRTVKGMTELFHCGADKIVLNTYALQEDPTLITAAAEIFGSQSVVLNVEAKKWDQHWECYSDGGRQRSGRDVLAWVREAESRGVGEIIVQSVDRDGRKRGFDVALVEAVKKAVSVPVVAASGAGSVADIVELCRQVEVDAVAVASILHYGMATIEDIKMALFHSGIEVDKQ